VNEKERRIMPLIVATYVCHTACLQRRTGSACTSLGPIMPLIVATTFATHPIYNADGQRKHFAWTKIISLMRVLDIAKDFPTLGQLTQSRKNA
jgi:hypothetical protein